MNGARDPIWYREEAKVLRKKAETVPLNDEGLRQAYLALAREYERLAALLEEAKRGAP